MTPVEDRGYDFSFLADCAKPKLFVSGDRDQYGPRAALEKVVGAASEPKTLEFIAGADHFFEGRLQELRQTVEQWVAKTLNE